MELERTGDHWRIARRGAADARPEWWDDLTASRDAVAAAVRSALSSAGITAKTVVTGLPRRLVTLKHARLPQGSPEQIAGMVQFEAQQYIPFPLDEVIIDHQVISDEGEEQANVLIAAARRSLIEQVLAVFDRAGLEVSRISVSTLALAEHGQDAAVPVGVLKVGAGELDLAVVAAGRLLFGRAAALNGGGREALAAEVQQSLVAYQTSLRAQPVSRLLLAGAPDDVAWAEQALGTSETLAVTRLSDRTIPAADPEALGFATVAGLAMEAGGASVGRINLVPASRAVRKQVARQRLRAIALAAVLLPCLAVGAIYVSRSVATQRVEGAEAAKWNKRLKAIQSTQKSAKTEHDRAQKTWQAASDGLGRTSPAIDALKVVSDAMPKNGDIYLAQFSFERGASLGLRGFARNERAVTDLVLTLQGSGAFPGGVRLSYLGDAQAESATTGKGTASLAKTKPGEKMGFSITGKLSAPVAAGRVIRTAARRNTGGSDTGEAEQQ